MSQKLKVIHKKRVLKRKSKHPKLKAFFGYFLLIALLSLVSYFLFFSSLLKVQAVEVKNNQKISSQLIKNQIEYQLEGKYFNWIKKDNLLLVSNNKLVNHLLEKFRLIRKVEIKKKFPSRMMVFIQERKPSLIFNSAGQSYLLDENGQAYDNSSSADSQTKKGLITLIDESNKKVNLGMGVLDKNYLIYIKEIKSKIERETNLKLTSNFRTVSLISNNIKVKTQEGWEIYFNKNIKIDKELEALKAVLNKEIKPQQRQDLKYIDLRINNKVYYRFKDGTPENSDLSSSTNLTKAKETKP